MPPPLKLSSAQARERMEMLAPGAAEVISDILDRLKGIVADDIVCGACKKEMGGMSVTDLLSAIRELRFTCDGILDRGGAPVLKRVESAMVVKHYSELSEGDLRKRLAEKLAGLSPEDRKLLAAMHPDAVSGE